ncbi:probable gluconokinase isoform X1 [Lynx canadensis]|uniref:probable gluconokinase isoform X1 n=1 Tax=Lynx canadensis TaxID=61383 RepID=UPI0011AFD797|nr:probable gluconokinase isoform X1 [Lynx canadensis]
MSCSRLQGQEHYCHCFSIIKLVGFNTAGQPPVSQGTPAWWEAHAGWEGQSPEPLCPLHRSTVGSLLASELGWKFYDADDYHPEENRMKMEKGIPLNDQDRIPWLCNLHDILLRDVASGQHVVLACSALKKVYRDILIRGKDGGPLKCEQMRKDKQPAEVKLLVVYLSGSFEVISGRLLKRKGHFMPPELLQSQFDTLEPPSDPENFIQINVDKNLSEIIATIMGTLR